jgi:hypothetical protein
MIYHTKRSFLISYDPIIYFNVFNQSFIKLPISKILIAGRCSIKGCTCGNIKVYNLLMLETYKKGNLIRVMRNNGKQFFKFKGIDSLIKRSYLSLCKKHYIMWDMLNKTSLDYQYINGEIQIFTNLEN